MKDLEERHSKKRFILGEMVFLKFPAILHTILPVRRN